MNNPDKVITHHSATKDGIVLKNFTAIKNNHINVKGWKDIGYHLVIEYVNGKLECLQGRNFDEEGAHCLGQNDKSIGVCCVGNFDVDVPSQELYEFFASVYMSKIYPKYGKLPLKRHNEFSNTNCPGKNFNLEKVEFLINRFDVFKANNIPQWKIEGEKYLRDMGYTDKTPDNPERNVDFGTLGVILRNRDNKLNEKS